jgi:hypothetical protein
LLNYSSDTGAHVQLAYDDGSSTRNAYQAKIDQRLRELASLPRSTHRDALVIEERLRQRIEQELVSQAHDDDDVIKYGPPNHAPSGNAVPDGTSFDDTPADGDSPDDDTPDEAHASFSQIDVAMTHPADGDSPNDDTPDDAHASFSQIDVAMTQSNDVTGGTINEGIPSGLIPAKVPPKDNGTVCAEPTPSTASGGSSPTQMANHFSPFVATIGPCAAYRPAKERPRGRRAGRRHPPPERLAHLRGARLLRLINAGR